MSLATLFADFSTYLHSDDFRACAQHVDHPKAFTRRGGKLPLPTLVATMLCGMRMSVQAELDTFFAHLKQQAALVRHVSEQAFAQARAKLSGAAMGRLNDWLIQQAQQRGKIPRWRDLRLVAADASSLRFALRACHRSRTAAVEQIAFALFLPGAELTLAASLHTPRENERQMLFEHLDRLRDDDLLLLDRGYPSRWLAAALNQRGIRFCMRVDASGFACVRQFLASNLAEQSVTLDAPSARDTRDYECPRTPQTVRLVRHIAPNGCVRVLMTNLLDGERFPASSFGDLYHRRWRIEEAFKRLKHRLALEHVTGLSQLAAMQDFAAKILCDNLQALLSQAAREEHALPAQRRINRAYAHTVLKPLLPALLLGQALAGQLREAIALLVCRTYLHRAGLSKPRPPRQKPHKSLTQKAC